MSLLCDSKAVPPIANILVSYIHIHINSYTVSFGIGSLVEIFSEKQFMIFWRRDRDTIGQGTMRLHVDFWKYFFILSILYSFLIIRLFS